MRGRRPSHDYQLILTLPPMVKAGKVGLLLGVVTGALTGLLFAPEKGKELRKNIVKERQAGGLGHKAIAHNMAEMADEGFDLVKEGAKR